MSKCIAILGCGWLGLPLAKSCIEDGFKVKGSTTSPEKLGLLKEAGILAYKISLSEEAVSEEIHDFLFGVDVLVINVPPKLRQRNAENYVEKMRRLHKAIKASKTRKIIFASSTSVYGEIEGEVSEDSAPSPVTASGKQLLESEKLFVKDSELNTTIIRFGGLLGPKRHPIHMLAGKKLPTHGKVFTNLIHLDDAIRVIQAVIAHNWWNELFNAVYPKYPFKDEYYTQEAKNRGLIPPQYQGTGTKMGKKILSSRLIHVKKFRFNTSILS
ncbi:NAD(P)H-binding protein [Spongiimicrobium sp. 2-473A-2-J]|uniref:NAD(P)H-binding protein n=1 Tax=Eudoraea algarum TaxID=3417568 RepID=UPI003D3656F9